MCVCGGGQTFHYCVWLLRVACAIVTLIPPSVAPPAPKVAAAAIANGSGDDGGKGLNGDAHEVRMGMGVWGVFGEEGLCAYVRGRV